MNLFYKITTFHHLVKLFALDRMNLFYEKWFPLDTKIIFTNQNEAILYKMTSTRQKNYLH